MKRDRGDDEPKKAGEGKRVLKLGSAPRRVLSLGAAATSSTPPRRHVLSLSKGTSSETPVNDTPDVEADAVASSKTRGRRLSGSATSSVITAVFDKQCKVNSIGGITDTSRRDNSPVSSAQNNSAATSMLYSDTGEGALTPSPYHLTITSSTVRYLSEPIRGTYSTVYIPIRLLAARTVSVKVLKPIREGAENTMMHPRPHTASRMKGLWLPPATGDVGIASFFSFYANPQQAAGTGPVRPRTQAASIPLVDLTNVAAMRKGIATTTHQGGTVAASSWESSSDLRSCGGSSKPPASSPVPDLGAPSGPEPTSGKQTSNSPPEATTTAAVLTVRSGDETFQLPAPLQVSYHNNFPRVPLFKQKQDVGAVGLAPLVPMCNSYKYTSHSTLGEGTYGAVYGGVRLPRYPSEEEEEVAVKVLKPLPNVDGFPHTSIRELNIHRFFASHPEEVRRNLLVLEDLRFEWSLNHIDKPETSGNLSTSQKKGVYVEAVRTFLVFPYIPFTLTSLRHCIREQRRREQGSQQFGQFFRDHQPLRLAINEELIIVLFYQVLLGIQQLHHAHIIHRDIKEDNILISQSGDVKLCDFGLAVPLDGNRAKFTPSLINLMYRPPEMLVRAKTYSAAVDIWSAGCLLAQQFLGMPPFMIMDAKRPSTELEQLTCIVKVLGPLPRRLVESCDPEIVAILVKYKLVEHEGQNNKQSGHYMHRFTEWFATARLMMMQRKLTSEGEVSKEVVLLMYRMLALDPDERVKIEELLTCACNAHPPRLCWLCRAKRAAPEVRAAISALRPLKGSR